jgi:hypothetical protein
MGGIEQIFNIFKKILTIFNLEIESEKYVEFNIVVMIMMIDFQ